MIKRTSGRLRLPAFAIAGVATVSLALAAGYHARGAYKYLNVFQEVWGLTQANYVESVDQATLLQGAYRGMLSSLDAASAYLDARDERALSAPMGPADAGMGVLLSGGIPVVVSVTEGGPADEAGLSRGDQIWRLGGRPLRQTALPVLERLLSGQDGDVLKLVVLDASTYKLGEVELTLSTPASPGFRLVVEEGPILRLRIDDPRRVDAAALGTALREAQSAHAGAPLLVDLRGLVGVETDVVARLAGTFLPGGSLLRLIPRSGPEETVTVKKGSAAAFSGRVYVMVDGGTAGTGEAIAAIAQEVSGAVLCGRKTYGLGGVPE
ncbi:MAG: S41 family peptidase, partial [Acidobacteriota bacterium]|nr:S41 family peptidase [Acidobacteriota bacterium]